MNNIIYGVLMPAWLLGLSIGKKIALGVGSLLAATTIAGAVVPISPQSTESDTQQNQTAVDTKEDKKTSTIDFKTETKNDNSLNKGETKVVQEGETGERTIVYRVTYKDGVETSRDVISDTVTKKPVNKVVVLGTYVAPKPAQSCPNGTYVNTAGNVVCRPYESSNIPSGASAKCRDGTYSFSQSRRGTCSHHGGVSVWY